MKQAVEAGGRTVEEAVRAALDELGVSEEEAEVEVLAEPVRGLLGLARRDARVRVTAMPKKSEIVAGLVERIAAGLGARDVSVMVVDGGDCTRVDVKGDGLGCLIGRRGQTLDAIQYLANVAGNRAGRERVPVTVDVDGYRERREVTLRSVAGKAADRVARSGLAVRLEPMSPFERRVIHLALQDDSRVVTASEGEEPFRRVVISDRRS